MGDEITAVLTGEFFWGVIVGLVLSILGAIIQIKLAASAQRKHMKRTVKDFCIDTVRNVIGIITELDSARDRSKAIHHDFLALIDVEMAVFNRNREHLINLPDDIRSDVRKFMNDAAIRRAEIALRLEQFYRITALADQIQVTGNGPDADRKRQESNAPLADAQKAADKLVGIATRGSAIVDRLIALKV